MLQAFQILRTLVATIWWHIINKGYWVNRLILPEMVSSQNKVNKVTTASFIHIFCFEWRRMTVWMMLLANSYNISNMFHIYLNGKLCVDQMVWMLVMDLCTWNLILWGVFLEIIKHGKKGCLKMTCLKPISWNFWFQVLESVTKNSVLMYIYILTLYRYSYIFKQNCNVLYYIDHRI